MKGNEILCSNCGAIIENDDYEEINGQIYCTDCVEHEFIVDNEKVVSVGRVLKPAEIVKIIGK